MQVILLEKIGKLGRTGTAGSRQTRIWEELPYSQRQSGARHAREY